MTQMSLYEQRFLQRRDFLLHARWNPCRHTLAWGFLHFCSSGCVGSSPKSRVQPKAVRIAAWQKTDPTALTHAEQALKQEMGKGFCWGIGVMLGTQAACRDIAKVAACSFDQVIASRSTIFFCVYDKGFIWKLANVPPDCTVNAMHKAPSQNRVHLGVSRHTC